MALFTGQNADLTRVIAAWIDETLVSVPVYDEYRDADLPYVIVKLDRRGELDNQDQVHGRSPNVRIEYYADDYEEVGTIQEKVFALFRHAKNTTITATDGTDSHVITFVKVTSYSGSQEPWETDLGYWARDYFQFEFVEV